MDATYMAHPLIFLIDTLASLYILAILLRFLLQWTNANFYNPISQFLVKITHPPLKILRRFIPSLGKIDTASLVFALMLQMLADFVILLLKGGMISFAGLAILAFSQLLALVINIFVFSIFIRALLSWFNQGDFGAASDLLGNLTDPVLTLCRRLVPEIGGMDLSPLIALMGLQVIKMMILPPLQQLISIIG